MSGWADREESRVKTERKDAAENRQRILETALRLFDELGVDQVSMNQIASEAQIGPGTLYRRYRNKSELCQELIKEHMILLFDEMEAYLREHSDESPRLRLRSILTFFVRFREKKAQLLAGVEEGATGPRSQAPGASPVYEELHGLLGRLLEEIAESEDNPPSSEFRADMLLTALKRDSYQYQRYERGYTPEEMVEQLLLTFA